MMKRTSKNSFRKRRTPFFPAWSIRQQTLGYYPKKEKKDYDSQKERGKRFARALEEYE